VLTNSIGTNLNTIDNSWEFWLFKIVIQYPANTSRRFPHGSRLLHHGASTRFPAGTRRLLSAGDRRVPGGMRRTVPACIPCCKPYRTCTGHG